MERPVRSSSFRDHIVGRDCIGLSFWPCGKLRASRSCQIFDGVLNMRSSIKTSWSAWDNRTDKSVFDARNPGTKELFFTNPNVSFFNLGEVRKVSKSQLESDGRTGIYWIPVVFPSVTPSFIAKKGRSHVIAFKGDEKHVDESAGEGSYNFVYCKECKYDWRSANEAKWVSVRDQLWMSKFWTMSAFLEKCILFQ